MVRRATIAAVVSCAVVFASALLGCDDKEESAQPDGDVAGGAAPTPSAMASGSAEAVDDKPTCRDTDACRYEGRCEGEPGKCTAGSDEDCRAALACKDWGTCAANEGRCVARSKEDCQASWTCKNRGRCSHGRDKCVVDQDSDCRRSDLCKYERKCQAYKGRCRK